MDSHLDAISRAVESGDDKEATALVKEALAEGMSALDILDKGLVPGIQALGKLFKDGQVSKKWVGLTSKKDLIAAVSELL